MIIRYSIVQTPSKTPQYEKPPKGGAPMISSCRTNAGVCRNFQTKKVTAPNGELDYRAPVGDCARIAGPCKAAWEEAKSAELVRARLLTWDSE